jgi:hypothetical protein
MQEQRVFNLKTLFVGALGVSVGLLLVIAAEFVIREDHPLLRGLLEATAISLITGGLLGLAYEFVLRRELVRHFDQAVTSVTGEVSTVKALIDQRMGLASNIDLLGLVEVCPRESHYNYSEIIVKAKKLYFSFNDGRTWFSNHEHDLYARAQIIDIETHVLLVHPESPFIDALGAKVSLSGEDLRRKIDETVKMLARLQWKGLFRVYGHMMPTTYSLVLSEEQGVFVPYHMARKVDKVPCFMFSAAAVDGFYASLRRDVDALIEHSQTEHLHPKMLI